MLNLKTFDPIILFIDKIGVDISLVKEYILGEKYAAVILKNGNIGLAANIINVDKFDFKTVKLFDIENLTHRLFLLAFFNAVFNNLPNKLSGGDIFDIIDFSEYENIVMVGYSIPMFKKLKERNCVPFVFDNQSDEKLIIEQRLISEYLKKADSVILTGTSIINNSFKVIIETVNEKCDVFLIGPSATFFESLLNIKKIKGIFGTQFNTNDKNVIRLIRENEGTNCLKKYGKKFALINKEYANL
ncbi:MAG: hypothetical protein GXO80_00630 [Chlorobi bacterium]|nr:hypothetical protein [Chlorobiota bacterium]